MSCGNKIVSSQDFFCSLLTDQSLDVTPRLGVCYSSVYFISRSYVFFLATLITTRCIKLGGETDSAIRRRKREGFKGYR